MAQAFAEHAMKRQVVMPRHQPVPAPVFLRAPGRAHHDRAQINGAILCRQRSHGRHTATPKTKWSAPKSAGPASPTRRTNNKIVLLFLPPGQNIRLADARIGQWQRGVRAGAAAAVERAHPDDTAAFVGA